MQKLQDRKGCLPDMLQRQRKVQIGGGNVVEKKDVKNSTTNRLDNSIDLDKKKSTDTFTRSKVSDNIDVLHKKEDKSTDIDSDETCSNNINVMLNYADMLQFMETSMCCRMCKSNIDKASFHRTLCGLASSVYFKCKKCQ